jgi:endo-1,4-beta-xylanase
MQVPSHRKNQKQLQGVDRPSLNRVKTIIKAHPWRASVVILLAVLSLASGIAQTVVAPSAAFSKSSVQTPKPYDMSWFKLPGATHEKDGSIHINQLNRSIVNQNGTSNQTNPPVVITGYHLEVNGDFKIDTVIGNYARGANLRFYGSPPVIYDEWRMETPSISLDFASDGLNVSIWDGNSDKPVVTQKYSAKLQPDTIVDLVHEGKKIVININGVQVASVDDHHIFGSGNVWFGADSQTTDGWTLSSLASEGLNGGSATLVGAPSLNVKHDDPKSLRNLAVKSGKTAKIGAAIALNPLMTNDKYRSLAGGQFSILTPENEMKAQFIHPGPNTYTFEEADTLVDFAIANDMAVHGHALVFGEANPKWMQDTPATQLEGVMTDHIQKIVSHYAGKVAEWDVVNEPLADNASSDQTSSDMRQSIWYKAMGEEFIDKAFKAAHNADPAAKLYLNEFGLEEAGNRWDTLIALIGRLQARHVPIDGIGFQSHVYVASDHEDPAILRSHIQQLAKLGLVSRISEIDVHGDDAAVQASEYAGVLGACLAQPTCTSFSTWGITDLYGSTTQTHAYPLQLGDDLLWDENFSAKPAFKSVQTILGQ